MTSRLSLLDRASLLLGGFAVCSVGLSALKGVLAIGFATALSSASPIEPASQSRRYALQSTIAKGEQP